MIDDSEQEMENGLSNGEDDAMKQKSSPLNLAHRSAEMSVSTHLCL